MSRTWRWQLLLAALVLGIVAIVVAAVTLPGRADGETTPTTPSTPEIVRADTRYLDKTTAADVTVVEFLDFECESCGFFYPSVEQLREKYAGKVNFAIRYFPIPQHQNSTNAAVAVEAAAQQGHLDEMYRAMFENQTTWGEKQESQAAVFRGYADELGLDLASYDDAVADPDTRERVESDRHDGIALGVTSTPTFFVDGQKVTITAVGDLEAAIQEAVADAAG